MTNSRNNLSAVTQCHCIVAIPESASRERRTRTVPAPRKRKSTLPGCFLRDMEPTNLQVRWKMNSVRAVFSSFEVKRSHWQTAPPLQWHRANSLHRVVCSTGSRCVLISFQLLYFIGFSPRWKRSTLCFRCCTLSVDSNSGLANGRHWPT